MTSAPRRDLAPLLVFLAAAAYFLLGATARDIWTTGEHRYAEVARVVDAAGADHLVPHLNGDIYPDKPPLFFWLAGAAHCFLGVDLPLSAKLPSILGGAFTVMLTFLLGRRFYGRSAGLVAAGALATGYLFDYASRVAHIDGFLTTVIVATLYCFVRADATPREERARRNAWSALGFTAVGLGILVKGPPAPLIPGATILAFLLWTSPRELKTPTLLWGALLALLPGVAWAGAVVADLGMDGARAYIWGDLLHGQAIAHAAGDIDKQQPWPYYLWQVPANLLPWTLFLPLALWAAFARGRPDERRADRFVVAWLFVPWLVFSFSVAKRNLYLVPIHPAAALLVGRLFRDAAESRERVLDVVMPWTRRLLAAAAIGAGALLVVAATIVLVGADGRLLAAAPRRIAERAADVELLRSNLTTAALLATVALGAVAAWSGVSAWRATTAWRAAAGLIVAVAAWQTFGAAVLDPARDADESPRAFLADVRARVGDAPLARLGGDGGLQYAVNWMLERDHVDEIWKATEDKVDVAETRRRAAAWLAADGPRWLVTDAKTLKRVGGPPDGAVEVLRRPRHRGLDLVLFGNAAATR